MYRADTIVTSWLKLIAWRQNYDPSGKQLEDELTTGKESGLYFQDEHPLLTLQNLESIMPDWSLVTYPDWNNATAYTVGEIVKYTDGKNYISIQAGTNQQPDTATEYWKEYNAFSQWLKQKTIAGITDTFITFLERKELNKTGKALLERKSLFDGVGNKKDVINNLDRRAGFEIVTSRSMGLLARLNRVAIQMTAVGDITVQLHHTSQENPLQSLILSYTKANSAQWFDLNWDLPHDSDDLDTGGSFFITYKQSELTTNGQQAIKKEKRWDEPCYGCESQAEVNTWRLYSPYLEFHPFTTPEIAGDGLWDYDDNRYEYDSNFGMNFEISLYCDYTDFFIKQRDLFKSAIRKQVTINLLRELAYNPNSRINQNESTVTRSQILYEIDGDTQGRNTGIGKKYHDSIDAILLNTEGLNRVCLPCKKNGVKYRGI